MKKIVQVGLRLVAQFYYLITPKAKTKVFNNKKISIPPLATQTIQCIFS